tara:strand:+ start:2189 stop:3034 length:846 start_codon:yes stop_codon:yes gene_type:complete
MNDTERLLDPGTLYLVATPIGNLGDISARALLTLSTVNVVACEDTRKTGKLLELLGLRANRLLLANEHTELAAAEEIAQLLAEGLTVALVTDAGMPAISDPGQRIVDYLLQQAHRISAVPGPSAVTTAIALAGFPVDRWVMEGFLPRKGRERSHRISEIAAEQRTTVIFESPKRLRATLVDLVEVCGGERRVAVLRELTKMFEETVRGQLDEVCEKFTDLVKGEIVIVVAPKSQTFVTDDEIIKAVELVVARGETKKTAVAEVSKSLGVQPNRVYRLAHDD